MHLIILLAFTEFGQNLVSITCYGLNDNYVSLYLSCGLCGFVSLYVCCRTMDQ